MFWLRNKNFFFQLRTLIWGPGVRVGYSKSIPRITVWHQEACRLNSVFLSYRPTHLENYESGDSKQTLYKDGP